MAFSYFRKSTAQPEPAPTFVGATFGPWATHETRCKCNVCR